MGAKEKMYQLVSTIDNPEFINLQPTEISPFISSCDIKVLYLGENRNHTSIDKEAALEMAKTLRGVPIVGYYSSEKQDFTDHEKKIIIEDGEIKFSQKTTPYGYVAPDAAVWFQKFEELDENGETVVREYLMTQGYLWTKVFEECQDVIDSGRPQSMELDSDTLEGEWAKNNKNNIEFFIINDATFLQLCILGNDVEPCFEGASITQHTNFTKMDDSFKNTLFSMIQELQKVIVKGGKEEMNPEILDNVVQENCIENEETIEDTNPAEVTENAEEPETPAAEPENAPVVETSDTVSSDPPAAEQYALLKQEFENLQTRYSKLEQDYNALVAFKKEIENKQKDELINRFYMLSDEDKKDVIDNKDNYTLDEIEAKLSVIGVRKKINFSLEEENNEESTEKEASVLFNVASVEDSAPAWLKALRNTVANRN